MKIKTIEGSITTFDNVSQNFFNSNPNIKIIKLLKNTTANDGYVKHTLTIIYTENNNTQQL